tara:strand:+ start:218 stop:619 length:402 start_codon:yes stop_codon:yes gene_type:complete
MAYFAEIDILKRVTRVISVYDEDTQDENGNEDESVGAKFCNKLMQGGTWLQTSYNTYGGVHSGGGTPFRKNFAGKGFTYDETRDAFIPPKPYPSWTLIEEKCLWEAPVSRTKETDPAIKCEWNETEQRWDEIG